MQTFRLKVNSSGYIWNYLEKYVKLLYDLSQENMSVYMKFV